MTTRTAYLPPAVTIPAHTKRTLTGKLVAVPEYNPPRRTGRAHVVTDGAYETQKSRADKLPKGAVPAAPAANPVLSGGAELIRLLRGQSTYTAQLVIEHVAKLDHAPKVSDVRGLILHYSRGGDLTLPSTPPRTARTRAALNGK
jgi:hypothetical protein